MIPYAIFFRSKFLGLNISTEKKTHNKYTYRFRRVNLMVVDMLSIFKWSFCLCMRIVSGILLHE